MISGSDYQSISTSPPVDSAYAGAIKINSNFRNITFCLPCNDFASLPTTGNNNGDVRKVLDTGKEYMYLTSDSTWHDYESTIINDEIGAAAVNLLSNTIICTYDSVAPSFKWEIKSNSILNAHINSSAAIDWSKISKSGSTLSDLDSYKHNDLQVLQGGSSTERYHLTQAQYDTLTNGSNADSLHVHAHNSTTGIQGGAASDYYHLTQTEHDTLTDGSNGDSLHVHAHNSTTGIQGGASANYYHLTQVQHDTLTDGSNGDSLHSHAHNSTTGLQGGSSTERYHLTQTEHDNIITTGHSIFQKISGTLAVGTKQGNFLLTHNGTFQKVFLYADTAPTGSAIIVDINKNGTSIFSSALQIADSQHANNTTSFSTTTFSEGDRLSIDIDQVGSTTPGGSDLLISILTN